MEIEKRNRTDITVKDNNCEIRFSTGDIETTELFFIMITGTPFIKKLALHEALSLHSCLGKAIEEFKKDSNNV
jgi:hypothetical protein